MATQKLLLLPGDGIGPEVMTEVQKLISWMNKTGMGSFETESDLVGGSAYDAHKVAITDAAMKLAHESDAVVFGAQDFLVKGSFDAAQLLRQMAQGESGGAGFPPR